MSRMSVKLGLVVALGVSLGLLTACSSPSSSTSASTAPAAATTPQVTASTAPADQSNQSSPLLPPSALSSSSNAAPPSGILSMEAAKTVMTTVTHGQWVPVKVFAPEIPGVSGLTGVVVVPQQFLASAMQFSTNSSGDLVSSGSKIDLTSAPKHVAFIFNQSHYVIMTMMSPEGQPLDALALQKLGLAKTPAQGLAEAVLPGRRSFLWEKSGSKAPIITAFIDPNCIWCHELVKKIEPMVNSGSVRVRVVLVGFLKSDSQAKAATILASKAPSQALLEDEHKFDVKTESGGIKPLSPPPADLMRTVSQNTSFMGTLSDKGTPMMLFCNQDHQVKLVEGLPQDLAGLVKSASTQGNPACAK